MSVAELYATLAGPVPAPRSEATAGTAGDGYMRRPAVHGFAALPLEPGMRALCAVCGSERDGHVPSPRSPR